MAHHAALWRCSAARSTRSTLGVVIPHRNVGILASTSVADGLKLNRKVGACQNRQFSFFSLPREQSRTPLRTPSHLPLQCLQPTLASIRCLSTSVSNKNSPPSTEPQSPTVLDPVVKPRSAILAFRPRLSTRRELRRLQQELIQLRLRLPKSSRYSSALFTAIAILGAVLATYHFSGDFRRLVLAAERCTRVGWAVVLCIIDYKMLFRKTWSEDAEGKAIRHQDYEDCHSRCAVRLREVLKKNGGIYIKLGQHLSAVQLIPKAWSSAMRPLQDQCQATPLADLQELFLSEMGAPLSTFFSTFDPEPIGVASLAQVHIATDRLSGQKVAVKIMHPDLEEFCKVDMKTTSLMLKMVKRVFPTFEFTWLGEEMEQNLPLEMDFRHEAGNAARCEADFSNLRQTTLVVPRVLWAKKRAMVMEFIEGARVDNLQYLAEHGIDRNRVAQELSRIFSRMIYVTGFLHGDPHAGNLLIRPSKLGSRSPCNFEIVLLDHGLYFDLPEVLRINYAHLWISLLSPASPSVEADRRKYAYLAGNIDDSLYPIFEAAITGRAALDASKAGKGSIMDLGMQTKEEAHKIRTAVVAQEGLMESLFDLLRRVPRRMLMVLKVNDLTRNLDASLNTTHGYKRVFFIVLHYANLAVWMDDKIQLGKRYRTEGFSFFLARDWMSAWWRAKTWSVSLRWLEWGADMKGKAVKWKSWWHGLVTQGWKGAWEQASGLEVTSM
ncbi:ABC1-domain-containing protein [Meredithblackwellia eburnea MCA 4105]